MCFFFFQCCICRAQSFAHLHQHGTGRPSKEDERDDGRKESKQSEKRRYKEEGQRSECTEEGAQFVFHLDEVSSFCTRFLLFASFARGYLQRESREPQGARHERLRSCKSSRRRMESDRRQIRVAAKGRRRQETIRARTCRVHRQLRDIERLGGRPFFLLYDQLTQ